MSLILSQVKKSYRQGDQQIAVLQGLDAEIKDAEVVAVLGQSGSGKSTLLGLLAGLDKADSGQILINGIDLCTLSQEQLTEFRAKNIGIVFQQFHLMAHLTALENVMLPLEILGRSGAQARAKDYLEMMELAHRQSHFPSQLSGGECQRLAIARALIVEPAILLADEPSGNLDIETGARVMSSFFSACRRAKVTTIVVTHSAVIAEQCDRKLFLQAGKLV